MPATPRRTALENAVRLALVGSVGFSLTLGWLDDPPAAAFAVFGSFAFLLFADFGGSRTDRLRAYLLLALVGAVLTAIGTACSQELLPAVAATAVCGFLALFSGVLGGSFAAGSTSAILVLVLSVAIPAPLSDLPSRLLGWGVAAALAIPALLLLWPTRPRDRLHAAAAAACHAFAALARARVDGDAAQFALRRDEALAAVSELRERFYATPYRPTGASGRAAALAALVDDLDWLAQFAAHAPPPAVVPFPAESVELERAVAELLETAADRLDGGLVRPDFARLTAARAALGTAVLGVLAGAPAGAGAAVLDVRAEAPAGAGGIADPRAGDAALRHAFALRMLSYSAWHLAADALRARGEAVPEVDELEAAGAGGSAGAGGAGAVAAREAVVASGRLAAAYASTRSVWFRNSVRGAVGLGLAVAIGQMAELQHAFWAVLAMVSTLRSRAVNTGFSLLQALGGTFAGIVAGGLLVAAIDGDRTLLWCALPFTLLLAAYAPRAISFVAGQAAFSLAVLVIFNLIRPVGWQVGLVRIEDIAIGGAISLAVGLLLWPRGAAALLRGSLATAYASSAAVLTATVRWRLGDGATAAADRDGALAHAIAVSVADARRLDDALRQCLSEPGGTARERFAELTRLVAGAGRVRRTAHSLRSGRVLLPLTREDAAAHGVAAGRAALERELDELSAWLLELGEAIGNGGAAPPAQPAGAAAPPPADVATPAASPPPAGGHPTAAGPRSPAATVALAWAHQHLAALRRLEAPLAEAADGLQRAAVPGANARPHR